MLNKSLKGTIDGRYVVLRQLGDGGMGTVYEAREIGLDRIVAVKILHNDQLVDSDSLSRFKREGKVLSQLSHANIITFYRFGLWQESIPYIAMEFLNGINLQELINQNEKLSADRCIALSIQICHSLVYLHASGIIHRDLKPNNIMICNDAGVETVKLLDFGLARMMADKGVVSQHLTGTGEILGSVYYMSPEQGRGLRADQRSDIYALGCVMYAMLTGSPPLHADNPMGIIYMHQNKEPRSFKEVNPELKLPERLEDVIFKCMRKEPIERYSAVQELLDDLQLVQSGKNDGLELSQSSSRRKKNENSSNKFVFASIVGVLSLSALIVWFKSDSARIWFDELSLKNGDPNSVRRVFADSQLLSKQAKDKEAKRLSNMAMSSAKSTREADAMVLDTTLGEAQNECAKGDFVRAKPLVEKALLILERLLIGSNADSGSAARKKYWLQAHASIGILTRCRDHVHFTVTRPVWKAIDSMARFAKNDHREDILVEIYQYQMKDALTGNRLPEISGVGYEIAQAGLSAEYMKKAEQCLNTALALPKDSKLDLTQAALYLSLIRMYMASSNKDEALILLTRLEKLIEIAGWTKEGYGAVDLNYAAVYFQMGELYEQFHQSNFALKYFKAALACHELDAKTQKLLRNKISAQAKLEH